MYSTPKYSVGDILDMTEVDVEQHMQDIIFGAADIVGAIGEKEVCSIRAGWHTGSTYKEVYGSH